jgi:quercetin dioxygenase-like cupin family protein
MSPSAATAPGVAALASEQIRYGEGQEMGAGVVTSADAVWTDGYGAPSCTASGDIRSALFSPEGYSLWQVDAELSAGAELAWDVEGHGEEAVYVLEGELEVDGTRCGPETTAIVEAGAAAHMRALTDTKVIHFGPSSTTPPADGLFGPPSESGRGVHVFDIEQARPLSEDGSYGARYYADSTCDTCRITFFKVSSPDARTAASHIHSEDEIIHVLTGELRVGPNVVGAGTSVAIPGNYRYGFRTPGPFSFLNYRRDASTYIAAPGTEARIETVDAWKAMRESQAG